MRIQTELCHIDDNKAIVRVSAWKNETPLGSALGEGKTTASAEEDGLSRLLHRISMGDDLFKQSQKETDTVSPNIPNFGNSTKMQGIKNDQILKKDAVNNEMSKTINRTQDPNEWSKELASVEEQVRRLEWDRDTESQYLKNNFGISDRSRITSYKDLIKYLQALKNIDSNQFFTSKNYQEKIQELLKESNLIINDLKWSTEKARQFLKEKMFVSSRQELNIEQLTSFNELLKREIEN